MSLRSRISRLEEKSGDNLPYKRVMSLVSHKQYPPEKLEAFLQENGINPEDPETFIIHRVIVAPDCGGKGMFDPYFR